MIQLVCDSSIGIPEAYAKEHNISIVPLRVLVGDKEFEEDYEKDYSAMFEEVEQTKQYPKTSQVSYELYKQAFDTILSNNHEVICVTIASSLSGTNSVAHLAKNDCLNPELVTIIDSGNVAQPSFMLVAYIIEKIHLGKTRAEIATLCPEVIAKCHVVFVPETLGYLKHGGRIGKLSALLGSILQIKPILRFTNNCLSVAKKSLGMMRALADMVALIPEKIKQLFVLKCGPVKNYDILKQLVEKKENIGAYSEGYIGPVIGAHVGPAVGLAWMEE